MIILKDRPSMTMASKLFIIIYDTQTQFTFRMIILATRRPVHHGDIWIMKYFSIYKITYTLYNYFDRAYNCIIILTARRHVHHGGLPGGPARPVSLRRWAQEPPAVLRSRHAGDASASLLLFTCIEMLVYIYIKLAHVVSLVVLVDEHNSEMPTELRVWSSR